MRPQGWIFSVIDDDLKAEPIYAPGFNEAVMRIWLGMFWTCAGFCLLARGATL